MSEPSIYTIGGTVQAGGGIYIPRKADDELLALCRTGTFAYVLTPRQMGKSSLMVRTAEALDDEGIRSVIIDLSSIGAEAVTPEQWHLGLLDVMEEGLDLETDVIAWWQAHEHLGMSQRLILFYEEVLLAEIQASVVILIDEIDTTLNLDFSDDFFAAIRYVYNARARAPAFKRLSFVLIGVATPSELVSDPRRTPFNIGGRVDLTDFTFAEARPFASGLGLPPGEAEQVLHRVLKWTGGHPYLTQRLCKVIADNHHDTWTDDDVEAVVHATFFGEQSEQDSNLLFIRDWLTLRSSNALAVLKVYRNVRLSRHPVHDEEQSAVKSHLKLSGVVLRQDGVLHLRNPIYARVFDRQWINAHWPESWFERIPRLAWALIVVLMVAVVLLAWGVQSQTQLAENESKRRAEAQAHAASTDSLNEELIQALKSMSEQRQLAESRKVIADSIADVAEIRRVFAVQEAERADSIATRADSTARMAENQRVIAEEQTELAQRNEEEAKDAWAEVVKQKDLVKTEREITLSLALTSKSIRQQRTGDHQLAALLAREAFQFSNKSGDEFIHEVYDALRKSLNELLPDALDNPRVYWPPHNDWVRAIVYSPDGTIYAIGNEPKIYRWRLGQTERRDLKGHQGDVRSLALNRSGTMLASGSIDGQVGWWHNLDQDEPAFEVLREDLGLVRALAFSPAGTLLAVASDDNWIRIWNVDKPAALPDSIPTEAQVNAMAFSPRGQTLGTGDSEGCLRTLDLRNMELSTCYRHAREQSVNAVAFSLDGETLAAGGDNKIVTLWCLRSGRLTLKESLREHGGPIHALAFSPDSTLASGSGDGTVRLWQLKHLDTILPIVLDDHRSWVYAVAFSEDGQHLISGSADRTIRRWYLNVKGLFDDVCPAVNNRNLSREEWLTHIGRDIPYSVYQRCSTATH